MEYDDLVDASKNDQIANSVSSAKQLAERISKSVPNLDFGSPGMRHLRAIDLPQIRVETTEEKNEFQSAAILVKSLANEALGWKEALEEGYFPAVIAILHGGIQIQVNTLSQVSFHGIRIEGKFLDGGPCTLLAHQATVQVLCHAIEEVDDEPRRPIGFIWEDNEVEV